MVTRCYQETFNEAYYDISPSGKLRLVLRKSPDDHSATAPTQTIVVESFWKSDPGVTVADEGQINAAVTYAVTGGTLVQTLSGAGSLFFEENKKKDRLTGRLGLITLQSKSAGTGDGFLERIELCGTFSAGRDSTRTLQLANETKLLHQSLATVQP